MKPLFASLLFIFPLLSWSQSIIVKNGPEAITDIQTWLKSTLSDSQTVEQLLSNETIKPFFYSQITCEEIQKSNTNAYPVGKLITFKHGDTYYDCADLASLQNLIKDISLLEKRQREKEIFSLIQTYLYYPIVTYWTFTDSPPVVKEKIQSFLIKTNVVEAIENDPFLKEVEKYNFLQEAIPTESADTIFRTYVALTNQTEEEYKRQQENILKNLQWLQERDTYTQSLKAFLKTIEQKQVERQSLVFTGISAESQDLLLNTEGFLNDTQRDIAEQVKVLETSAPILPETTKEQIAFLQNKQNLSLMIRTYLIGHFHNMLSRVTAYEQSQGIQVETSHPTEHLATAPTEATTTVSPAAVEDSTEITDSGAKDSTSTPKTNPSIARPGRFHRDDVEVTPFKAVPAQTQAADLSNPNLGYSLLNNSLQKCFSKEECLETTATPLNNFPDFVWGKIKEGYILVHLPTKKSVYLSEKGLMILYKQSKCKTNQLTTRLKLARDYASKLFWTGVGISGESVANAAGWLCQQVNERLICSVPNDYEFTKEMWDIANYQINETRQELKNTRADIQKIDSLFQPAIFQLLTTVYPPEYLNYYEEEVHCDQKLDTSMYMMD